MQSMMTASQGRPVCTCKLVQGSTRLGSRRVAAHARRRRGNGPSSVSEGLITVLKDELKIEKERYRQSEELMEGPPEPFEVQYLPTRNAVTLARQFGNEDILVEVDLDKQQDSEEDDEYDSDDEDYTPMLPLRFTVSIIKTDALMEFECESTGDYVTIKHLSLEDGEGDDELASFPAYSGPVFDELDETLQQAFQDYLEERGITAELVEYVMELVNDKLEVEYMAWLERVQKFVGSS